MNTTNAPPSPRSSGVSWEVRGILIAIALVLLWNFPYLEGLNNPNEHVRLHMTVAIVDHGTFAIARREPDGQGGLRDVGSAYDRFGWVNDKAIRCDDPGAVPPHCVGSLYAAKAPGTSYLGVPFYWAVSRGYSTIAGRDATRAELIYWLRLGTVILPTLLLLLGLSLYLERRVASRFVRRATLIGLGLGSMLFSYAPVFAGHGLAAACLGGGFLLLIPKSGSRTSTARALGAGLLIAAAVATEYPSALGAGLISLWLLMRMVRRDGFGLRQAGAFALGALPPAALLALFHTVCFGAPWRTAYTFLENVQFVRDIEPGLLGIRGPTLEGIWGSFFAPYNGLFFSLPGSSSCCRRFIPSLAAERRRRHKPPNRHHRAGSLWPYSPPMCCSSAVTPSGAAVGPWDHATSS